MFKRKSSIEIKSADQLDVMRQAGLVVAEALAAMPHDDDSPTTNDGVLAPGHDVPAEVRVLATDDARERQPSEPRHAWHAHDRESLCHRHVFTCL